MTAEEKEAYRLQLKHSLKQIGEKYYGKPGETKPVIHNTDDIPTPLIVRVKAEKQTKSPATLTAEKNEQTVAVEPEQTIVHPENVITIPEPVAEISELLTVKIPKTVHEMIGNTFNGFVKVLSYNADESLIPRGEKQKPLPHVDCLCLKCNTKFVVNAYRVSGGSQKSCGCDSKRKVKA